MGVRAKTELRGPRPVLPGTQKPLLSEIDAMIRVDHAGEFGALRIYEGQLAVLGRNPVPSENVRAIRRMAAQEQKHFDTFDRMVKERAVRPTALEPLWRAAGFALGAATALMGEKAAMACTVAVEDVIDEHYAKQAEYLADADPELRDTILAFRDDELAHRRIAIAQGAEDALGYELITA